MTHPLLPDAVQENVSWCALVSAAHGVGAAGDGRLWATDRPPPPLHPDAITLVPGVTAAEVLRALDGRAPCSVKDSFADLDVASTGLDVLLEATWIGARDAVVPPAGTTTARVSPERDLGPDVVVLDVRRGGAVVGRGTGHRHDGVIGLSNVGAPLPADLGEVFAALVTGVREHLGDRPVVGYEQDDELGPALAQGFEPLGPLRVLVRPAAGPGSG